MQTFRIPTIEFLLMLTRIIIIYIAVPIRIQYDPVSRNFSLPGAWMDNLGLLAQPGGDQNPP
jgi:hypothetical protein